ncbi:NAD(P)-dependent oxidoreductase [Conexibacter sp. CPCC 206217]|uniref:NAD(P)-dependent oxidoreductase n=1 Tax=Conexibacter sp. CPCC 206217 TaxID=3064574 RepID=UPI002728C5A6|nr:NAD(P)H-binding protein [Conexibacter sp. CPCC 206217]MDO8211176.1 NAD(P)H-binding protein [Conexibacter sp. CPCC 206217]
MADLIVFGAGGQLGRMLVAEALTRGLTVTAVVRDPAAQQQLAGDGVTVVTADATSADAVAEVAAGHATAISAVGPAADSPRDYLASLQLAILDGSGRAGVERLLVVGGAGSLELAPGERLVHTPDFPQVALPTALAHADALDAIKAASTEVDWVVVSPPAIFAPDGERTGSYRVGDNRFMTSEDGGSHGSYADYAIALLDEVQTAAHSRAHICVAD